MPSVGCTIKLAEDKDVPWVTRSCDLSITGERRSGIWSVMSDSTDPRLSLGVSSGVWALNEYPEGSWTAYICDNDWRVLLDLYGLTGEFLNQITCGTGMAGDGWHQGPPSSNVVYQLWWGCA